MSAADSEKPTSNGCENLLISEEQQEKIDEVRRLLGPLPDKLSTICPDASISRYLRAHNWNVKKATKLLKEAVKWRLEYKPEAITWDEVASEAETGKMYRSNYTDKHGRTVIVMRPSRQNSKSIKEQMRYLVYCMENAVMNLQQNQEEIVWLVDFDGFNMSNISLQVTRETSKVLQVYYPERLGISILYNPPKFFEPFWKLSKPILGLETAKRMKFVYPNDPNSNKIMEEVFDMDQLESAFGGKDDAGFDIDKYAERMREDDKRMQTLWEKKGKASESDPEALEEKAEKSSVSLISSFLRTVSITKATSN